MQIVPMVYPVIWTKRARHIATVTATTGLHQENVIATTQILPQRIRRRFQPFPLLRPHYRRIVQVYMLANAKPIMIVRKAYPVIWINGASHIVTATAIIGQTQENAIATTFRVPCQVQCLLEAPRQRHPYLQVLRPARRRLVAQACILLHHPVHHLQEG